MMTVESFLITKQGTMKQAMLTVKLDYTHEDCLYLAGLFSVIP